MNLGLGTLYWKVGSYLPIPNGLHYKNKFKPKITLFERIHCVCTFVLCVHIRWDEREAILLHSYDILIFIVIYFSYTSFGKLSYFMSLSVEGSPKNPVCISTKQHHLEINVICKINAPNPVH